MHVLFAEITQAKDAASGIDVSPHGRSCSSCCTCMIWQRIRIEAAQGNWPGGISSIVGPLVHGAAGLNTAHKAFSVCSGLVDGGRSADGGSILRANKK